MMKKGMIKREKSLNAYRSIKKLKYMARQSRQSFRSSIAILQKKLIINTRYQRRKPTK